MVSGVRFFACSGAMGGTPSTRQTPNLEIFNFEIGATNSPNRMGFFGSAGAPNAAITVGSYQDRTHRVDHLGVDLGQMINVKYTGSSSATVSGVALTDTGHTLATIPQTSGTLLARFTESNSTAVVTQSATFRAVNFDAGSGVPNIGDLATGIVVQAAQLQDTAGNAGDSSWTLISSGGGALSLADQSLSSQVHDYHLIVSGSPQAAGRKIDFGYYLQLEFF